MQTPPDSGRPASGRTAPAARTATDGRRLFRIGAVGAALTALCCVTPVLVLLFSALGLAAAVAWLDLVLLPLLGAFLVLAAYGWLRLRRARGAAEPAPSRETP